MLTQATWTVGASALTFQVIYGRNHQTANRTRKYEKHILILDPSASAAEVSAGVSACTYHK